MRFFHRCGKKKKQEPVFDALDCLYDVKDHIARFVDRFVNLVDVEKSVLANLSCKDFIEEVSHTSTRLMQALDNREESQALNDDLTQFCDQLKVIEDYYQSQIDSGQPVARAFIVSIYRQSINKKNPNANLDESDQARKYELNNNANTIMAEEIRAFAVFINRASNYTEESGYSPQL